MSSETPNFELEKVLNDQKRLDLDERRFAFEQRFINRNLVSIVGILLSFLTICVSATQFYISNRNQKAEMARLKQQHENDQQLEKDRADAELKIRAGLFIVDHEKQIFSDDEKKTKQVINIITASFPQGIVKEDLFGALGKVVDPKQRPAYETAKKVEQSARALATLSSFGKPPKPNDELYQDLSNALQAVLKARVLHSLLGSGPRTLTNSITVAQVVLAYTAIVPRADRSYYWYWNVQDSNERRLMITKPQTLARFKEALTSAQLSLSSDSDAAQFFRPEDSYSILSSISENDPTLRSLLSAENQLVKNIILAGGEINKLLAEHKGEEVSDALRQLPITTQETIEKEAFNSNIKALLEIDARETVLDVLTQVLTKRTEK